MEAQHRRSAEFVESSVLEAVVPADPSFDIEDELESWDGNIEDENSSVVPFVKERQFLLFDERAHVYVVFRTPSVEDVTLRAYLSRLAVTLDVFAFSTAPPPEPDAKPPPPKELIFSETIKDSNKPLIVRPDDEDGSHLYVIWKTDVFISRPRGRFYKPAIYFQPTANLKPAPKAERAGVDDEYLPSNVPTALNLLQPFESDPALAGAHPRLSALRISKIAPTAPVAKELTRPIRTGQRRLFRAFPLLIWRIRYSKKHSSLSDSSLIATLDLEIANVAGCSIKVEDIQLSLRGGQVAAMADTGSQQVAHKAGDQITYLYELNPQLNADGSPLLGTDGHKLTLKINAKALVSGPSQPNLQIEWNTAVDFTVETNPTLVKAAHRLSNLTSQVPSKILSPDSFAPQDTEPTQEENVRNSPINVTLTISGPPRVHVGEVFHWDVFIVNRSSKTRKLAILTMPKRKKELDRHKSNPSTSSTGGVRRDSKELISSAVVDENIVYAKQKSARTEVAELICLTTDVRIGHLAPGACYTADLRFLALCPGVLGVESVRLVDLATQEAADIRDLPSMIAVDESE